MKKLSLVLVFLMSLPELPVSAQTPEPKPYDGHGVFSGLKKKYLPLNSPQVNLSNSDRLEKMMRAGRIYLSLADAIALALENNLDIEYARFGPKLSDTDILRAQAGQLLRNLGNANIRSGPSSVGGALEGVSGVTAVGGGASAAGQGGILSGASVQLVGSGLPNLDPQAYVNGQFGHSTQILSNSFAVGTNYLTSDYKGTSYGITKGFLPGTTVQLAMSTTRLGQNSPISDFNPTTSGSASLTITQPLLQGFGTALNSRYIKIARNNRHSADLNFKGQVIATVSNVVDLYWDLVAYDDILKVRQHSLELNRKLYTDNKRRAELGAIAPIDIVQAEAEMTAAQQDVTNAETQVLQQEMILKNVLTRGGVDNIMLAAARIVPTDTIQVPGQEAVQPIQDLIAEALANRPEVEQSQISLENSRLTMKGVKNALLPQLNLFAQMQNNGLVGQMNTYANGSPEQVQAILAGRAAGLNGFFVGGYGGFLNQLLSRNFPDYAVGFSLSIPLSNRMARADLINTQLTLRQQQISDRQLQNNIKLNVMNARTALLQARAAYDSAVKARILQEQTLNGERRKFQLGTSSFLNVVIVQRDTVLRQATEVQALNAYVRARNQLTNVLGDTLTEHHISMEEAVSGVVKREPDLPIQLDNK